MPGQEYYATPAEQEQRKLEALESIAENLLKIQQLLSSSTDSEGTLVVGTQPPTYY